MEKRGVIAPGVTPAEEPVENTKESRHEQGEKPAVAALDNDFRKRAAEAARTVIN